MFYCEGAQCWESYNAALRALDLGYSNVLWYRGGLRRAGKPTGFLFSTPPPISQIRPSRAIGIGRTRSAYWPSRPGLLRRLEVGIDRERRLEILFGPVCIAERKIGFAALLVGEHVFGREADRRIVSSMAFFGSLRPASACPAM